ncbi:MAG: alkaline phosphatase family protein [Planctomycetes bacterium]|nr:alkaline phosphatase family protein [Planctomycetota bacterium]
MARLLIAFLVVGLVLATGELRGQEPGRLIVLGFDGLDYHMTRSLIEAGRLPNLAALAEQGDFRRLETTNPAISPVSWSALSTGRDPGRTGIDGFLRREFGPDGILIKPSLVERRIELGGLATRAARRWLILPFLVLFVLAAALAWRRGRRGRAVVHGLVAIVFALALRVSEGSFPDGFPYPVNLRQGETYWERLDRAGVSTATMLAPCSFPAPVLDRGRVLAGLGTPDALGTFGTWRVFRDDIDAERDSETGGSYVPLRYLDPEAGDGRFEPVLVEGPPNIVRDDGSTTVAPMAMTFSHDTGALYLSNGRDDVSIGPRSWSNPYPFTFKQSDWLAVRGFSRFKLLEANERVRLYLDPISLDPTALPRGVRLSSPEDYALDLMKEIGPYETVGWACATNALKDGALDEGSFLEDANRVWEEQENLAMHELRRRDARVVTCVITVPDRIQHMFQRYVGVDPKSLRDRDPRFARTVTEAYERVDHFVGLVRDKFSRPGDRLMIVSDHGMAPFEKAVNLNAFLIERGLLVLRQRIGPRKLDRSIRNGVDMAHVDWSRTKAYSLGLGRIYLNRAGREPAGIVGAEEADALIESIRGDLLALRDGDRQVVASAGRGDQLHAGEAIPGGAAEIYVGFARGYRVSWQTCLGGADEPVIFVNDTAWSGDHCSVDPAEVPGVLFSDLPLVAGEARVVDIAATVLDWAGLDFEAKDERDGRSLLQPGARGGK